MITLVAVMCHALGICREVIVFKNDMTQWECVTTSQAVLARWKEDSIYRGDEWKIARIECMDGDYVVKDDL